MVTDERRELVTEKQRNVANMAIGWDSQTETELCSNHKGMTVSLYCLSCEQLACTKCISVSQSGDGLHRNHVFMDVEEAYNVQKEEFDKLEATLKAHIDDKKNEKLELHSRLQALQLELLRKQHETEEKTKTLQDAITKLQKNHVRSLQYRVSGSIQDLENRHRDAEFDVVSSEGLLVSVEAIQSLPSSKCVAFLKNSLGIKKEILKLQDKSKQGESSRQVCNQPNPQSLLRVDLRLATETRNLHKAYDIPENVPNKPQMLYSWCTIGCHSASIVWKYKRHDTIDSFCLYYRPVESQSKVSQLISGGQNTGLMGNRDDFKRIKLRKFYGGRAQAVLRNLSTGVTYLITLCATNRYGESKHIVLVLETLKEESWKRPLAGRVETLPEISEQQSINTRVVSFLTMILTYFLCGAFIMFCLCVCFPLLVSQAKSSVILYILEHLLVADVDNVQDFNEVEENTGWFKYF